MKKTISFALTIFMIIPLILSVLSGCDITAAADDSITNGEFITKVNNIFDFNGYSNTEPYYSSVKTDNVFFDAVQTAVEFNVIDERVEDIKPSDKVTREFCAMILSGAINNDNIFSVNVSDSPKITYLDDVLTMLNYGIMELDEGGRFRPDEIVGATECALLIDAAYDVWTTCTVDSPEYNITLNDGVVDLSGLNCYSIDNSTGEMIFDKLSYNETQKLLTDNHFKYNSVSGEITIDSVEALGVAEDTILIVPSEGLSISEAVKIEEIIQNEDGTFTLKTALVNGNEVIKDLKYEQTAELDFSKAVFYDVNGNMVNADTDNTVDTDMLLSSPAPYINENYFDNLFLSNNISEKNPVSFLKNNSGKTSYSIKTDVFSVKLSVSGNEIGVDLSGFIKSGKKNEDGEAKLSVNTGAKIKDIKLDTDCDFHLFGNKHIKSVLNYSTSTKVGVSASLSASGKDGLHSKNAEKKLLEIGKFICPIDPAGLLSAEVKINVEISVEGKVEITLSNTGQGVGFEWRGGGISFIKQKGRNSTSFSGEVKVELTFPVTIALKGLYGLLEVGISIPFGVGAKMSFETTEISAPNNETATLICAGLSAYPIFKISIYAKINLPWPLNDLKAEKGWDILGEKNTILELHIEQYGDEMPSIVKKCTKSDRLNKFKEEEAKAAGVLVGDALEISVYKTELNLNETFTVNITMIPSGYSYEDLLIVCSDKKVLSVENGISAGKIYGAAMNSYSHTFTGLEEGNAILTFRTIDNAYSAECEVTVVDPNKPIDYSLKLSTYGTNISIGTVGKILIESMPYTITEDNVLWESNNTDVVVVDQYGVVRAVGEGYAIVTAATPDKKSTAACAITVQGNTGSLSISFLPVYSEISEVTI